MASLGHTELIANFTQYDLTTDQLTRITIYAVQIIIS